MGSPAFFRAKDGTLGVVSSQNNATGAIYVWDGKGDGATFTNERAITVTDSSMVTRASSMMPPPRATRSSGPMA